MLSAYPQRRDLAQMLRFSQLQLNLDEIAGDAGLGGAVYQVIVHAQATGCLAELFDAVYAGRPGNELVAELATGLGWHPADGAPTARPVTGPPDALLPAQIGRRTDSGFSDANSQVDVDQVEVKPVAAAGWVLARMAESIRKSTEIQRANESDVHPHRVVHQLPPDPAIFVGRRDLLDNLDEVRELTAIEAPSRTTIIATIEGPPGVGKTAVAVHWAHRNKRFFPDGEIYINIRGYDAGPAVELEPTLDDLLRALGVPAAALPKTVDAKSGLLRSVLHDSRVIMLIDNAASADQVRPFLPAAEGSMILVTSRTALSGLRIREGAKQLYVTALTASDAVLLLESVVGKDRVQAELQAASRLAKRCGYLPLALRIAAHHLVADKTMRIDSLLSRLQGQGALNHLSVEGDPESSVEVVFSWSYRTLPQPLARAFRLLGMSPSADITVPAAAALLGETDEVARVAIDQLKAGYLIESKGNGRYEFHDLIKNYAAALARADDETSDSADAVRRYFTWLLYSSNAADAALAPSRRQIPLPPHGSSIRPLSFESHEAARKWFESEHSNLVRAVHAAFDAAQFNIAWKLPMTMRAYFQLCKAWKEWIETHEVALVAVRHLEEYERTATAWINSSLGNAMFDLGRHEEAIDYHTKAIFAWDASGDMWGKGQTLISVGNSQRELGRFEESISSLGAAQVICAQEGNRHGIALTLTNIAESCNAAGRFEAALEPGLEALSAWRVLENEWGASLALRCVGVSYAGLSVRGHAERFLREGLELCEKIADRKHKADILRALAGLAVSAGEIPEAKVFLRNAAAVLRPIDPRSAEEVLNEAESL